MMRLTNETARWAVDLVGAGRAEQGRAMVARALQRSPNDTDLLLAMAAALSTLRQHDQALYYSDRATKAAPRNPDAWATHGTAMLQAMRREEAAAAFERAVELEPQNLHFRANLAGSLVMLERYASGWHHAREAMGRGLDHPNIIATGASALRSMGRVPEGLSLLRAGLQRHPGHKLLLEAVATAENYVDTDPAEMRRAHEAYAQAVARDAGPPLPPPPKPGPADTERVLRVGLLTPDLREHSCSRYIEPILANADRSRIEIHCFYPRQQEDATSIRFKAMASGWRTLGKENDRAIAERIRADRIDVLIEASGLSSGHRLGVMAMRPAPIQMTFLGYPNTTGLHAIDYRLVDALTDPPGSESHTTERLLRIEGCFLGFVLPPEAPPVIERPSPAPDKPVVFGSFNNVQKVTDDVVRAWARILQAVPNSRLMVKSPGLKQQETCESFRSRFAPHGIDGSRIDLLPTTPTIAAHLAAYGPVDLALDTFPYNGTTTTSEALLMGVPVVALEGKVHAARVGVSLLTAAGMPELIAPDTDAYVRVAVDLASNPDRLTSLRRGLRERMMATIMYDGPGYARRFEAAIRVAWKELCSA